MIESADLCWGAEMEFLGSGQVQVWIAWLHNWGGGGSQKTFKWGNPSLEQRFGIQNFHSSCVQSFLLEHVQYCNVTIKDWKLLLVWPGQSRCWASWSPTLPIWIGLIFLGLDPLSHLEVKIQLGSLDGMASSGLAALNSNGDARGLFQPVCQV